MTTSTDSLLQSALDLPEEEQSAGVVHEDDQYHALLARLSHQSVVKHYEAFRDIPWDDPDYAIDPADPRFELPEQDTLGATDWYRALPQQLRAKLGLHMTATFMKVGNQFENVLTRGLLEFALKRPNGSPEFRYAYHEAIEESQHTLMFQEFVNRSGIEIPGMPAWMHAASRLVVRFGRTFPELFFLFVLGGEDPIDHVQRTALKEDPSMHPLVRRICQIHVTEEARHLTFARAYLRRNVPRLSRLNAHILRLRTPMLLGLMARPMTQPSPEIIREYGVPRAVVLEAYTDNPTYRHEVIDALRKVRELCVELDIARPPYTWLWRRVGIWETA